MPEANLAAQIEHIFRADFPVALGEQTIRALWNAYPKAATLSGTNYLEPEAHDLHSRMRRGLIEQDLRSLAARIRGVQATAAWNLEARSYYTEIRSGRLILTESHVPSHGMLPSPAEFRIANARKAQLSLLEPNYDDGPVYGIVTHGEDYTDRSRSTLGFVMIGFPDGDCDRWLHRINLFDEYAELVATLRGTSVAPSVLVRSKPERA